MFKKLISYFIPFTKKIKTQFSGLLEVRWINGHKVLDTSNANYSYGSSQRILKFALEHIELGEVENILLLGLGGGSVIKTLREHFSFAGSIVAVDIDPVIIRIAEEEFSVFENETTKIECDDALDFLKKDKNSYSLIIVDLFIDNKVPDKFLSVIFWEHICRRMKVNGFLIFNSISSVDYNIEPVKEELEGLGMTLQEFNEVEGTNRIVIGKLLPLPDDDQ